MSWSVGRASGLKRLVWRRAASIWCTPVVAALIGSAALAQPSLYEAEPNNTPAEAQSVSGEVILMGTMEGSDQDAFLWSVSDVDAQKRWTLELEGIPGALTLVEVLQVEFADNGVDVVGSKKYFAIGSRDGTRPGRAEDLIFEPGEYVLGFAFAGGGSGYRPPIDQVSFDESGSGSAGAEGLKGGYRLSIREGSGLWLTTPPPDNDSQETASRMRLGSEFAALAETAESWFRIDLNAAASGERWDVNGQVPVGRQASAFLRASDGEELARAESDQVGQFAFRDLGLEAGTYYVEMRGAEGGMIRALAAISVGQRIEGAEAEPNDTWARANRADLAQPVTGRAGRANERDHFQFVTSGELADRRLEIALEADAAASFELCLLDGQGTHLQCRSGKGSVVLPDLVLEPGGWGVLVGRGSEGSEYSLRLREVGEIEPGQETEPNDSAKWATAVPSNNRIKGRFLGDETDFYRVVVTEEPQLWRFQVIGESIHELAYHDSTGIQNLKIRAQTGQRRVRLDNVFLLPGEHHVRVTGRGDGEYTLLARPIGPPDPNGEREPNDDTTRMQPLRFGQTRTGLLEDIADRDNYRLFLADWEHIRLRVEPPSDGSITGNLQWDGFNFRRLTPKDSGLIELDGLFPPGNYRLELQAAKTSEAEYNLSLERLPRFGCAVDCEPNDNAAFASPIPSSLVVEGQVGEARDYDFYQLPVLDVPTELTLSSETQVKAAVVEYGSTASILKWDGEAGVHRAALPLGRPLFLRIGGTGPYRLELQFDKGPDAIEPDELSLEMNLTVEMDEVAAYRSWGQTVAGQMALRNNSDSPRTLQLETATSHHAWRVELAQPKVTVEAGETLEVPLTVYVPADAWADRPVRISARALDETDSEREAFVDISAGRDARSLDPRRAWQLPAELLGGFNVAWRAIGGERQADPTEGNEGSIPGVGRGFHMLFDGMAVYNEGLLLRGGRPGPVTVTVELAGDQPVEVVGMTFHPLGSRPAAQFPRDVEVQLSLDGSTYETALRERMEPLKKEQTFVLEQPSEARFARLVLTTNYEGWTAGITSFGEWKVIARPGVDPSNGKGFNLAEPELGGHVVWSRPQISGAWDVTALTAKKDANQIRLKSGQRLEWVVGFHHERAAQIERLEWAHPEKADAERRIESVTVSVSTESPLGPWEPISLWELAGDSPQPLRLDQPVWARYVKFSAPGPEKLESRWTPETIRIWERPTSGEYRSVLAEWGWASQEAIYESLTPLLREEEFEVSGNGSRAMAQLLPLGRVVRGQVALGREEDWYGVVVPAGENTLSLRVGGEPTVRAVAALETEAGEPVPLRQVESKPRSELFEAVVEPGATYYIRVEEPPRNVMFLWDTSASVGAYLPVIYTSLMAYAEGVVPGRDACNFLPFGSGRPLLRDWYGEPYILQTVLNDYPRSESSSEAEATLATASKALAGRPGTKAVVLVTDAATNRYGAVWDDFGDVRPRIFGLGLSSHGAFGRHPRREQDLMQSWSRVNGGYYSHVNDEGEMEVAFDRAATILRRPAGYTLEATSAFREAPGPGTLRVVSGDEAGPAAGGAVELILDASGSMLQRLEGKRRIDVAREVLTEAVTEHLPAGTPLALRVFGHKEAGSCRTDLEIPLGPLDPLAAAKAIGSVNAKNLAKTPIADSLAKVASDLKGAKGKKIVILVTDGEETCDGDPEQVIQQLQDQGIDVRLNIVGFAIGEGELARRFEGWAELGGGRYFSAENQSDLSSALEQAITVPFAVYDTAGTKVTEGAVDGEPLELEQGFYRVVVDTAPPLIFEKVEVPGEEQVVVEVGKG